MVQRRAVRRRRRPPADQERDRRTVAGGLAPRLVPGRARDLRHAVRARPGPEQAFAARRPLHRPRRRSAARRAGAHGAASPRVRGDEGARRASCWPRASGSPQRTPPDARPTAVFNGFLDRLRAVRVLDPACGSGNFLYVALQALKDLEREAILWGSLTFQDADAVPAGRPAGGPRDRAQLLRGRARPGVDLDRRDPVDAQQRLRLPARPDPAAARQHRDAATRSSHGRLGRTPSNPSGRAPTSSSATRRFSAASSCGRASATSTSRRCSRSTAVECQPKRTS